MISNNSVGTIVRSGVEDEQTFRIKASAKAFKILSSGLYANKIRAIVRELSANAYDAHKEANNLDIPFVINVPNYLDPVFKIRDFGTGIVPEDINTVYTTYFESPKSDSNDYIGCMGLGSKTPLCYTDSFTVVNYYNGKKYYYNAFLNEKECPTLALLGEEDTTEMNGLEVLFNVKTQDFYRFKEEVTQVLSYYKTIPKIEGDDDVKIEPVKYSLLNSDWGVRNSGSVRGVQAIMGNIAYPIINKNLNLKKDILNLDIDVFFDIGEFEVTASREDISYDKETIKNISEKLNKVCVDIQKNINNTFNCATSLWDAKKIYSKIRINQHSGFFHVFTGEWNGIKINSPYFTLRSSSEKKYDNYPTSKITFKIENHEGKLYAVGEIDLSANIIFVVNNATYAIKKRLSELHRQMSARNTPSKYIVVVVNELEPGIWDKYRNEFLPSDIEVVYLNDFDYEKVVSEYGEVNPIYTRKILRFNNNIREWEVIEKFDMRAGGIFVPIKRFKIHDKDAKQYIHERLNIIEIFNGNSAITIYGVKETKLAAFQNDPRWKTLDAYCKEEFEKNPISVDVINYFRLNNSVYAKKNMSTLMLLAANSADLKETAIYDYLPFTNEINAKYLTYHIRDFVYKHYAHEFDATELIITCTNKCNEMINKYCPFISMISCNDLKLSSNHLISYLTTFLPKKA